MKILSETETNNLLGQFSKPAVISLKANYPYELLSDREFEILLYSIYKSKIEKNDVGGQFDDVDLMQDVGERGIDVLLCKDDKPCGVIQCKHSKDPVKRFSGPEVAKEIIKFVLHYLLDRDLISDPQTFTYFIAVSADFSGPAAKLINDPSEITRDDDFQKWVCSVISAYEAFKDFKYDDVQTELSEAISHLKVEKVIRADLEFELSKDEHKHVVGMFFEQSLESDIPKRVERYRRQLSDRFARKVDKYLIREDLFNSFKALIQFEDAKYIALNATSGYGKTSFMYWLVDNLDAQAIQSDVPPVPIYYFIEHNRSSPIGLLKELNAQMLVSLGSYEKLENDFESLSTQFRDLLNSLCKQIPERSVFILIDGFDELNDKERQSITMIFPVMLEPNLYIVIASKPIPELTDYFDWDHEFRTAIPLTIPKFSTAEVQGLLVEFQIPAGFGETGIYDVANRIHALTDGHALWTRAVCRDIAQNGLAELQSLESEKPRGFIEYIKQQLRDSELDNDTIKILGFLSISLGPLTINNLAELLNESPEITRRSLKKLSRLVEDINGKYSLFHRLVQEHLLEEVFVNGLDEYDTQIISWGYTFAEDNWPSTTPEYLVRWFAQHLACTGSTDSLYSLITSQDWTELKHFGTEWGESLTQDFELASTKSLDDFSPANWYRAIALLLRKIAIESSTVSVENDEIMFLTKTGKIERALSLALRNFHAFNCSIRIVQEIVENNPPKALDILEKLVEKYTDETDYNKAIIRLRVATTIFQNLSLKNLVKARQYAEVVKSEAAETIRLLQAYEEADEQDVEQVEHIVAFWFIPLLAITNDTQQAEECISALAIHNQVKAHRQISRLLCCIDNARADQHLVNAKDLYLDPDIEQYTDLQVENFKTVVESVSRVSDTPTDDEQETIATLIALTKTLSNSSEFSGKVNWSDAIKQIARFDLVQAKELVTPSNNSSSRILHNYWEPYLLQLAIEDLDLAFDEFNEHFSGWLWSELVLGKIIGSMAARTKDTARADELIKQYSKRGQGKLGRGKCTAYRGIADAYLELGQAQKAEEIFYTNVLPTIYKDHEAALFNLVGAYFGACEYGAGVEPEYLISQFDRRNLKDGARYETFRKIGWIASEQKRVDFLKQKRHKALTFGAVQQVLSTDPKLASEYLVSLGTNRDWKNDSGVKRNRKRLETNILAQECVDNPANIGSYLEHFIGDNENTPHHMCSHMMALPNALCRISRSDKSHRPQIANALEKIVEIALKWQCKRDKQMAERFLGFPCECIKSKNDLLCHSIGIMSRINFDRALSMTGEIEQTNLRLEALRCMLTHCEEQHREATVDLALLLAKDAYGNSRQDLAFSLLSLSDCLNGDELLKKQVLLEEAKQLVENINITPLDDNNKMHMRLLTAQAECAQSINEILQITSELSKLQLDFEKYRIVFDICTEFVSTKSDKIQTEYLQHLHKLALRQSTQNFVQAILVSGAPIAEFLSDSSEDDFWNTIDMLIWVYRNIPSL